MRVILSAFAAVVALAGCDPQPPYSNITANRAGGVGFGDYQSYMRAQEELARIRRAQQTQGNNSGSGVMTVTPGGGQPASGGNDIGAQAVAAVRGGAGGPEQQPTWQQTPQAPAATAGAPLSAVSPGTAPATSPGGQTAVSDQRFTPTPFGTPRQNQMVERDFVPQVRVESVPQGTGGPNLFAYALATRHNVGEVRHSRSHPLRWRRWESACAQFRTQDAAQEAFLAAGGPDRDPNHLDPDGDGFACWWDPAPFRQAARAAQLTSADVPSE